MNALWFANDLLSLARHPESPEAVRDLVAAALAFRPKESNWGVIVPVSWHSALVGPSFEGVRITSDSGTECARVFEAGR